MTVHILRCMGPQFCVKFQRCSLKFHTKFWTHCNCPSKFKSTPLTQAAQLFSIGAHRRVRVRVRVRVKLDSYFVCAYTRAYAEPFILPTYSSARVCTRVCVRRRVQPSWTFKAGVDISSNQMRLRGSRSTNGYSIHVPGWLLKWLNSTRLS